MESNLRMKPSTSPMTVTLHSKDSNTEESDTLVDDEVTTVLTTAVAVAVVDTDTAVGDVDGDGDEEDNKNDTDDKISRAAAVFNFQLESAKKIKEIFDIFAHEGVI